MIKRVDELCEGDLIVLEDDDFRTSHKRGSLRIVTELHTELKVPWRDVHVLDVVTLDRGLHRFHVSKVMRVFG